ncbi:MAG: wax ester/triacylglycerol synthase family O-acyltransferase [Deltaproteobacteria bacterium]|nr:wax ester/triacylglycerol synthase family O-acyltransferase [Deltaproteobacteria bacterium]
MNKALTLIDLAFLALESQVQTGHVGGLAIFKLPKGAKDGFFQRAVETHSDWQRTEGLFRLVLRRKGVGLGWVEEEQVDVASHIQYLALPKPGTRRQLYTLAERLHAQPLNRRHPLWEVAFIEGLEGGCGAIYVKIHHALADGISAIRLWLNTFSTSAKDHSQLLWHAQLPKRQAANEGERNVSTKIMQFFSSLSEGVMSAAPIASTETVRSLLYTIGAYQGSEVSTFMAPRTLFNRQITNRRRFASCDLSLQEIRTAAKQADATVNDVVLMICASALRRYLLDQQALPETPLTTWMPISTRREGDTRPSNQIAMTCVSLATHLADARARFQEIRASAEAAKQDTLTRSPEANNWLAVLRGSLPLMTDLLGVNEFVAPAANLTISNVPGLNQELYFHGAKLEVIYPMSVLMGTIGLNITLLSCGDTLGVGLLACPDTVPELEKLAGYVGEAFAEFRRMNRKKQ